MRKTYLYLIVLSPNTITWEGPFVNEEFREGRAAEILGQDPLNRVIGIECASPPDEMHVGEFHG